jgi:hypothetical protein
MDFTKYFEDLKSQVGPLATASLNEFADAAKKDGEAFLEDSKPLLEEWTQQLASGELTPEEFASLMKSQTTVGQMQALREENAATIKAEQFRDSLISAAVSTAVRYATNSGGGTTGSQPANPG